MDHGTSWTFPWMEPTHTVTILAMNSVGISAINSNLTLSQQMSTGKSSSEWDVGNARNPGDVHRESFLWGKNSLYWNKECFMGIHSAPTELLEN